MIVPASTLFAVWTAATDAGNRDCPVSRYDAFRLRVPVVRFFYTGHTLWWDEDKHVLTRPGVGEVWAAFTNLAVSVLWTWEEKGKTITKKTMAVTMKPIEYLKIREYSKSCNRTDGQSEFPLDFPIPIIPTAVSLSHLQIHRQYSNSVRQSILRYRQIVATKSESKQPTQRVCGGIETTAESLLSRNPFRQ